MIHDSIHLFYLRSGCMLSVNTMADLNDLHQLCHTICDNILNNPHDAKYQQIKLSNKSIQTRLLTKNGGLDFLYAIGFEVQIHDFQKVLVLNTKNDDYFENIQYGLIWLDETINTCINMAHKDQHDKPCAEYIIQIQCKGLTVTGGFLSKDKLENVVDFVKCFYEISKTPIIYLRSPHRSKAYEEECMIKSLEELELGPRSILIASSLTDEQVSIRMNKVKQEVNGDTKTNIANAEQVRLQKLRKNEKDNEHKNNLLMQFQEDRNDFKERNPK